MSTERPQFTGMDNATVLAAVLIDVAAVGALGYVFVEYWKEIALVGLGAFVTWLALSKPAQRPDIRLGE